MHYQQTLLGTNIKKIQPEFKIISKQSSFNLYQHLYRNVCSEHIHQIPVNYLALQWAHYWSHPSLNKNQSGDGLPEFDLGKETLAEYCKGLLSEFDTGAKRQILLMVIDVLARGKQLRWSDIGKLAEIFQGEEGSFISPDWNDENRWNGDKP